MSRAWMIVVILQAMALILLNHRVDLLEEKTRLTAKAVKESVKLIDDVRYILRDLLDEVQKIIHDE